MAIELLHKHGKRKLPKTKNLNIAKKMEEIINTFKISKAKKKKKNL